MEYYFRIYGNLQNKNKSEANLQRRRGFMEEQFLA
jgi:hypothetical protein